MSGRRVGIIRVVTRSDEEATRSHGALIERLFGLATLSACIADQPDGIHDASSRRRAVPKVISLARELAPAVDAVFVSCCDDPGVDEAGREVDVPIVGAGSAAAASGLASGDRIGILNLTERTPPGMVALLGARLVATAHPASLGTTHDINTERGLADCVATARSLVRRHRLDVLLLGCTGMADVALAGTLAALLEIPVIDPVIAGGVVLAGLVGGAGLTNGGAYGDQARVGSW